MALFVKKAVYIILIQNTKKPLHKCLAVIHLKYQASDKKPLSEMKRRRSYLVEVKSNHPEAIPFMMRAEARKEFVLCYSVDQISSWYDDIS